MPGKRYRCLHQIGPRLVEGTLVGGYDAGSLVDESDLGDAQSLERLKSLGAVEEVLLPQGADPGPAKPVELLKPPAPQPAEEESPPAPRTPQRRRGPEGRGGSDG